MESPEITLVSAKGEPRVDSRLLASQFGSTHQHVRELLRTYREDFEQLGILRFQTGEIIGRGQPEKFALLNENQCYLLLTFSRNTATVRPLKVRLVKAFGEARMAANLHLTEYLPTHHALHDTLRMLAAGSPNERFVHINASRLINDTVGIESGQRQSVGLSQRAMLTVAQTVAIQAIHGAADHHQAYQQMKGALLPLGEALRLGSQPTARVGGAQ